jgi:hypothetical protein
MKKLSSEEFEIERQAQVPPSPEILEAIKQDYKMAASIADLVDNAIDAQARRVLVRFLMTNGHLQALCVIDNGRGMDSRGIDRAMKFGERRNYASTDLGMFGVGLKSASLSQADVITVFSKSTSSQPVGRQWTDDGIRRDGWMLNVLTPRSAKTQFERDWWNGKAPKSGTIVKWDKVRDFDRLRGKPSGYLENLKVDIQRHLGLKLHRFIEEGTLQITLDTMDLATGETGVPSVVKALNPFPGKDVPTPGGWPKLFTTVVPPKGTLQMRCHIWPKRSVHPGYKLGGGRVAEHQGFYFYRHRRLIQDGGWNGYIGTNEPHLSLARVEIDIPDAVHDYLRVRPSKAGVDTPPSFSDQVDKAKSADGMTFKEYLEQAEKIYRVRPQKPQKPILKPGEGIAASVKDTIIKNHDKFIRGQGVAVVWGAMDGDDLFQLDRDGCMIIMNEAYRETVIGEGQRGAGTDAPILRTSLYLLLEPFLRKEKDGAVMKQNLDLFKEALRSAAVQHGRRALR